MTERRAVAFSGCAGWLRPGAGRRGVVLCPAFGLEGLTARRAWGELADRLAEAGLPTLSFDWPGTGDSIGDDRDPDRPASWRAGLEAAIDTLRHETGVEDVVLIGLRLGATIAAEVAARRGDVATLVALQPVVSGRLYVREQRSLSRLLRVRGDDDPIDADEVDGWAVGGFFTSDATGEALAALDLRRTTPSPAAQILLLAREADVAAAALADHWRGLGAQVTLSDFAEVDTFLTDPTKTIAPVAAWSRIVEALADGAAPIPAAAPVAPPAAAVLVGDGWSETAHAFGPEDRLIGVLTVPERPLAGASTVIVLSAGRNPHLGWGRGTVELARSLARQGRRVLRMDQAGIGDSRAHPDGPAEVLYSQEAVADVVAALDRFGSADGRNVVIGACSGAHLALHATLADARVRGVAMINLQRFVWRDGDSLEASMRGEFRSSSAYAGLVRRADTWKRLFRGEIRVGHIAVELVRRIAARLAAKARRLATTDPAVAWLRRLERRGVHVLFVFGTDDGGRDEFAEHVGAEAALSRIAPHARVESIERTDHNLGPRDARRRLGELVDAFLARVDADVTGCDGGATSARAPG